MVRSIARSLASRLPFVVFLALVVPVWANTDPGSEGPPVQAVLEGLQSPDLLVRVEAARRLPRLAIDIWTTDFDDVMPVIVRALNDPETEVRQMASISLFQATWVVWGNLELPPEKEPVVAEASPKLRRIHPVLSSHLDDPDPLVREYLLRALGTWMPAVPADVVEEALKSIDDASTTVAKLSLQVVGRAGHPTPQVAQRIVEVLELRPDLRATAVGVLGGLYADRAGSGEVRSGVPEVVMAAMFDVAEDDDEVVRLAVIDALVRIGGGSEEIRSRLQVVADDRSESLRVRQAAEAALARLGAKEATP